jgi:putative glutamine amidotransferase
VSGPPAIGVSGAVEQVRWGAWDMVVNFAPRTYPRAVQRAGALALILPPDDAALEDPEPWLEHIDALLLAGGADIDPAAYGQEPHPQTKGAWPERDHFEVALARAALERGMPVLGICRGMQLLNVAMGGTLEQHLEDRLGSDRHRHTPGAFADHEVRLEPGSLAARAIGSERSAVRSHHHQGVDRLGSGLAATGWSVEDNVIEAIEMPDQRFALGVLWHPEEDERSRVIGALVEATSRVGAQ